MDERVAKLPKWAQERMAQLERGRDEMKRLLDEFQRGHQDGKILISEMYHDGDNTQVTDHRLAGHRVEIEHAGCRLSVNVGRDDEIFLSWSAGTGIISLGDCCFIPTGYQQAKLVHPGNSRPGPIR